MRLIAFVKEIETITVEYLQEIFHLLVESHNGSVLEMRPVSVFISLNGRDTDT